MRKHCSKVHANWSTYRSLFKNYLQHLIKSWLLYTILQIKIIFRFVFSMNDRNKFTFKNNYEMGPPNDLWWNKCYDLGKNVQFKKKTENIYFYTGENIVIVQEMKILLNKMLTQHKFKETSHL